MGKKRYEVKAVHRKFAWGSGSGVSVEVYFWHPAAEHGSANAEHLREAADLAHDAEFLAAYIDGMVNDDLTDAGLKELVAQWRVHSPGKFFEPDDPVCAAREALENAFCDLDAARGGDTTLTDLGLVLLGWLQKLGEIEWQAAGHYLNSPIADAIEELSTELPEDEIKAVKGHALHEERMVRLIGNEVTGNQALSAMDAVANGWLAPHVLDVSPKLDAAIWWHGLDPASRRKWARWYEDVSERQELSDAESEAVEGHTLADERTVLLIGDEARRSGLPSAMDAIARSWMAPSAGLLRNSAGQWWRSLDRATRRKWESWYSEQCEKEAQDGE